MIATAEEAKDLLVDFWYCDYPAAVTDGDKDVAAYSGCGGAMDFADARLVDSALFDGVLNNEWGDCEYSQQHCDTKGQNHSAKVGGVLPVVSGYSGIWGNIA